MHQQDHPDKLNSSPSKTSSMSACTIILTIFGILVLLVAIAAIIVSVLLNSKRTSSNCTVTDSITRNTSSTTTMVTTMSTGTIVTTSSTACSNFTISFNRNYPGNDLIKVSPMPINICCAWCLSLGSSCQGYVYTISASRCWIKSSITSSAVFATDTISAIR